MPITGALAGTPAARLSGGSWLTRALALWNAACLDAPCVVVLWSAALARGFGFQPGPLALALLFSGVWMGYCVDRLVDGIRLGPELALTHRHRFAVRHRKRLVTLLVLALPATLAAGVRWLPTDRLVLGSGIAALAVLHTVLAHRYPTTGRALLPRELVVGGLLALAAFVFGLENLESARPALLGLAVLFAVDCWLVASFEVELDQKRGEASLAQRAVFSRQALVSTSWVLAVCAAAVWVWGGLPGGAIWCGIGLGAAGLAVLARVRGESELLPALADLSLCAGAFTALLLPSGVTPN